MTETKTPDPCRFHSGQRDIILALMERIGGDGHSIYKPDLLKDFPEPLQKRFVHTMESDTSHWKSTLYDHDGNVIDKIEAIHGLDVQEAIASDLGLEIGSFTGRGFRAQAAAQAIRTHFNL
jgi:hypothetical protein